jgi:O-antigen ligase
VPVGLTLALTYTRLAWGAAVIGLLVMMCVAGRRWLVPALLVVLLAAAALSPDVGHRIDQLTSPNSAVTGSESGLGWRLGQWADVARLADTNPVTGIGPDVVALRLSNRQPPHNDYLRAVVELGVVGLVAYVALLASLVAVAVGAQRRARGALARTVGLAAVGVVTAFIVASVAANLLGQVVLLWYVFAIAGAAAWVGRHGVVRTAPGHPVARLAGPNGPSHVLVSG